MPTLTAIPSEYNDGDTISWSEVVPGYSGGTVVYRFAGPQQFTVTGSGSGTTFTFILPTGKLPGVYVWQQVGTVSTVVTTLQTGSIRCNPNLAATAATSSAATMLAAAETAFTSLCAKQIESADVNGESYTYASRGDLLKTIQQLKATVQAENDALRIQQGLGTGRRILTRLSRW
jgi:hypothetical protein